VLEGRFGQKSTCVEDCCIGLPDVVTFDVLSCPAISLSLCFEIFINWIRALGRFPSIMIHVSK
jgi:hypothetical protein